MGSPSVTSERLRGTSHLQLASVELAKYFGISGFAATLWYVTFHPLSCIEQIECKATRLVGGMECSVLPCHSPSLLNLVPFSILNTPSYYNIPALDGDLMGRGADFLSRVCV